MGLTVDFAALAAQAHRIALRAIVADVQTECVAVRVAGESWWDTRPMSNPNEHSSEVCDMATEALAYGKACGALTAHTDDPHLVRINSSAENSPCSTTGAP